MAAHRRNQVSMNKHCPQNGSHHEAGHGHVHAYMLFYTLLQYTHALLCDLCVCALQVRVELAAPAPFAFASCIVRSSFVCFVCLCACVSFLLFGAFLCG